MNKNDYLIVGSGYAGMFMAHQLIKNHKSFLIFSDGEQSASEISAGIVNPAILKKFTSFWLAQEQINFLKTTLSEIAEYTGENYFINEPVHRIFHDENEKQLWIKKSYDQTLSHFLSKDFKEFKDVRNSFATGRVMQSGRLNVKHFFNGMKNYLIKNGNLIEKKFNYSLLQADHNCYDGFIFKHIIFCEGIAVSQNPYFSNIPIHPNKGHHLKVKLNSPLSNTATLKKKHFLFPIENGLYYYGSTYDRDGLHKEIDDSAVEQLRSGLFEIYPKSFETLEINCGFRPTVKDRRPIIGSHSQYKNLYVFNGLGARGILSGNYFARELFNHIEFGNPLKEEVNISRFYH